MNELMLELLEAAKGSRRKLCILKDAAVKCQHYELAAQLREYETSVFMETQEEKDAKELAGKLNLLFRMTSININESTCFLIHEAIKTFKKKKGNFSIHDASQLVVKTKQIFLED